jgi:hypothetical protein
MADVVARPFEAQGINGKLLVTPEKVVIVRKDRSALRSGRLTLC